MKVNKILIGLSLLVNSSILKAEIPGVLTQQQTQSIKQILKSYDLQIESALKNNPSDPNLYDEMQDQFDYINGIEDDAKVKLLLQEYQRKFEGRYFSALKNKGITLGGVVEKINRVSPKLKYQVVNNQIHGTYRTKMGEELPIPPSEWVVTSFDRFMHERFDGGCRNNRADVYRIDLSVDSIFIGDCIASDVRFAPIRASESFYTRRTIEITGITSLQSRAFAWGGGVSISTAYTQIEVSIPGSPSEPLVLARQALAPLLWFAINESPVEGERMVKHAYGSSQLDAIVKVTGIASSASLASSNADARNVTYSIKTKVFDEQ